MDTLNKLKIADLKKLLKQKNLSVDGNKATLINRILESENQNQIDNETPSDNLDADEDLLLGNDDNCEAVETENSAAVSSVNIASPTTNLSEETSSSPSKVCLSVSTTTAASGKMEDRMKRFGIVSDEVKKKSRVERFQTASSVSDKTLVGNGTSKSGITASQAPQVTEEQLKKRAERFGIAKSTLPSKQAPEDDLLKKRAERFGSNTSVSAMPAKAEENDAMLKRKARFATSSDGNTTEAKKQRRAERFGLASS